MEFTQPTSICPHKQEKTCSCQAEQEPSKLQKYSCIGMIKTHPESNWFRAHRDKKTLIKHRLANMFWNIIWHLMQAKVSDV